MLLTNILIEYGLVIVAALILLIWLPRHGINIGVDEFGWYLLVGIVINAYILCKREHNDHKTKKWNGLLFAKE